MSKSSLSAFPLISVIIPVYNGEKYIAQAIECVLNQTYKNIEVLVIDDGSTDDSLTIAKVCECESVKVFSQPNHGASAARNYGLREAKGDLIQFLDADDLLSSNKIEEQVKLLIENPDKIACCPTVHFFDGEDITSKEVYFDNFYEGLTEPKDILINLYGGFEGEGAMIQPNTWLVPKNIIDKVGYWNERLTLDDDGEFFCRVILASEGIIYAKKAINYYRKFKENKSLSAKNDYKATKSALLSLELKQEHLAHYQDEVGYKKAFARAYKRMAVQAYPQFNDIANACLKNIKLLGGTNHDVTLGGRGIEFIKKVAGWKIGKRIN